MLKFGILDSGGSCHMLKDKIWFEELISETKPMFMVDNDLGIRCEGAKTKTVGDKYSNPINLPVTDVSYVSQLRYNCQQHVKLIGVVKLNRIITLY
ncbi:hypothetical protein CEXT_683071 [Caerostris extrusa]|uniref:Retrovirus-related Pol polyprotein from transposon TNT 1-94-like beta-barrel domain-containing protein n=1 Tax=Caerostris extrusa TaxID=172846 RepID=A0AAV4V8H5_CAEEX|nr:hypothetical protein CEXT_683071 [Caerostris extrusa]